MIDEAMKPWLLEVNASPSLSVENDMDYNTKFCVLTDAMDVIDLEQAHKNSGVRKRVGGFDLVFNNGGVKQEKANMYVSKLGAMINIKDKSAWRSKQRYADQ